jgi:flagellar biosynthesis protein FlhF
MPTLDKQTTVRLKTYHSSTIESAIRLARIELGEDAMFLGSRRSDGTVEPEQAYEVTFAAPDSSLRPDASPAAQRGGAATSNGRAGGGSKESQVPAPAGEPPRAARRAHLASGQGVLLGWKQLLRQAALEDSGSNTSTPQERATDRKLSGRSSAISPREHPARPHWKQFVPIEHRGSPRKNETGNGAPPFSALPAEDSPRLEVDGRPGEPGRRDSNGATLTPTGRAVPVADAGTPGSGAVPIQRGEHEPELARQQAPPKGPPARGGGKRSPLLERMGEVLARNGIEANLAREILAALEPAVDAGADRNALRRSLFAQVRSYWKTDSSLGKPAAKRKLVALVGPAGSGKTTTVAKLAFRHGRKRPLRLLSMDQLRVGAVEPLHAYAGLMGVGLRIVDDLPAAAAALDPATDDSPSAAELVLIDTPGYGRREWDRARQLAELLLARGDVDVHLVLDARNRLDELRRSAELFALFQPAKLLFTRLDECGAIGAVLSEAARSGLPLSFVGVGQRVPEDLVPAGEPVLLRLLFRDRQAR